MASRSTIPRTTVAPPTRRIACRRAAATTRLRLSPRGRRGLSDRADLPRFRSGGITQRARLASTSVPSKPPRGTKQSERRVSALDDDDRCGAGMQVRETTIGQLIGGSVRLFRSSDVRYAWTTQELGQFWADILGQYQEIQRPTPGSTHFLGSIVLMPEAGAFSRPIRPRSSWTASSVLCPPHSSLWCIAIGRPGPTYQRSIDTTMPTCELSNRAICHIG